MTEKIDLRVQKTRKALADAFSRLLYKKRFEDITVNELCVNAGVRRATFYKHYTDKMDFLTSFIHSLRKRFDSLIWQDDSVSTAEYYVAYARRIVGYINENEYIINNVLDSSLLPTLISIIVEQNYKDTRERLLRSVASGANLVASVDTTARMLAGGVAQVLMGWLVDGKKTGADDLAEEIGSLISACFK